MKFEIKGRKTRVTTEDGLLGLSTDEQVPDDVDHILDILKDMPPDQDVILKIFPTDQTAEGKTKQIITHLGNLNFRFIVIKRENIEQHLLSFIIAAASDKWNSYSGAHDRKVKGSVGLADWLHERISSFDKYIYNLGIDFATIRYEHAETDLANCLPFPINNNITISKQIKGDPYDLLINAEEVKRHIRSLVDTNIVGALKTVCDLKWNYPIFNMERGEFRSCCRTPPIKISEQDLELFGKDAFLNSISMKQSRLELVRGVRNIDCQSCWNLEDSGMTSPRHNNNQFWKHLVERKHVIPILPFNETNLITRLSKVANIDDPVLSSNKPYMLEISLGNTCDMKCMYCSHHYSSQWATERIKYGDIKPEQFENEFPKSPDNFGTAFWDWFKADGRMNITRIGIIGGEPLITPEFYEFADKLIESMAKVKLVRKNKITLWLVTNLNTPQHYLNKFLDYLPKLTTTFNIEILVSMESVGERAEYIRNGVNWTRFTNNLDLLLSKRELVFSFGFIISLNVLNISTIKDFIIFTEELYIKHGRPVALNQNIISFPEWQSPMLLTPDFAKYIDECADYMESKSDTMPLVDDKLARWDSYATFLRTLATSIKYNTTDQLVLRKKFAEWFDVYDERRKMKLIETFPEYTDFYNLCKRLK